MIFVGESHRDLCYGSENTFSVFPEQAEDGLRKLRGRVRAGQGWSVEIPRKLAGARRVKKNNFAEGEQDPG